MPRELRIGDRVRTPAGEQVVIALSRWALVTTATRADVDTLYARNALYPHEWEREHVEGPLPADISRERVEAYHGALVERAASLRAFSAPSVPGGDLSSHAAEVQRIADELREMLEVPDAE